jgi:STE24 endopeptidase
VLAGAWLGAASLLWQTSVPDGLRLPELDAARFFTASELDQAENFEDVARLIALATELAILVALGLFAWRGHRLSRESAAGRIGTGMMLGMLGLAIVWLVRLPFAVVELWWQRRHEISHVGYVEFVFGDWAALGGEFLFVCLALLIVMVLAGVLGRRWWIAGAPVFVGLAFLFAFVYPYLLPLEPLHDPGLRAAAQTFAQKEGLDRIPVRVEEVGYATTAPNAEAAGFGVSRRVILWDTLLDGRFEDEEVRVVLAHEMAHHGREHLPKLVGWYALFALPGAWLIAVATRGRGGMARSRAVPLGLFVYVALQLAAAPLQNVVSRRLEQEADWQALRLTRDPDAARELFEGFTETALADPDPPRWAHLLLETHPSVLDRMAMADAWVRRGRP